MVRKKVFAWACVLSLSWGGCTSVELSDRAVSNARLGHRGTVSELPQDAGSPQKPHASVELAAFEEPADESEPTVTAPLPELLGPEESPNDSADQTAGQPLSLDEVLNSIVRAYPLLEAARQEQWIAYGNVISASGSFDTKAKAGALEAPLGFYETYRHYVGFEQPLYNGMDVFAGYRIGRGFFKPWYKGRETDEGGEFKATINLPLMQDKIIDERRANLGVANIEQAAAQPMIQAELIDYLLAGSVAYWDWVAAGQGVRIARGLLDLANERKVAIQERVDEGDLAEITMTDNQRLIASRRSKLIAAQQKYQLAAVKLSLFLRTPQGEPILPSESALPKDFPAVESIDPSLGHELIQTAWAQRPELASLILKQQSLDVELNQARNMALPELDWYTSVSQDVGDPRKDKGKENKQPLELDTQLLLSVPLQRRKALGKQTSLEAKIAQVRAKEEFTRNKIATQVQMALVSLQADLALIEQSQTNLELAEELQTAEEDRFREGESTIILVNIREQATADARAGVVAARADYFRSRAELEAALGSLPDHVKN
ncbi:TolC family protein [Thalassoroseus pseudoceratinae]|uniref:TolC family protein n=1 Tax=Thalassoroseus pseudoceratinae TaxID=2713176 RepID=UPI0014240388|nr:TolC family protein [Thalassoroseus pseudoceratinae]